MLRAGVQRLRNWLVDRGLGIPCCFTVAPNEIGICSVTVDRHAAGQSIFGPAHDDRSIRIETEHRQRRSGRFAMKPFQQILRLFASDFACRKTILTQPAIGKRAKVVQSSKGPLELWTCAGLPWLKLGSWRHRIRQVNGDSQIFNGLG